MKDDLQRVIEGVSNTYGHNFFNAITLQLAEIIEADFTFIARLDHDAYVSRTIALVADGKLAENFEYSLKHTPCAKVAESSVCCYPNHVVSTFPEDQLLIDMGIEAYLGSPLLDSHGNVLGLIVALYKKPIEDSSSVLTLFQIFSGRIAAEIERVEYEGQLVELNNSLEDKVKAQSKLIESEKLAALGNLVAGVAHEVNTPLGVTITAQSIVEEKFKLLCQLLDTNSLTVEAMNDFRSTMTDTLPLMASNLSRAVTLLTNFKKTAADQHNEKLELINFFDYCQQVLSTLHPLSKQVGVSIETNIDKTIQLKTYPGIYAQIITNLVTNSLNHAFDDTKNKLITISLNKLDDGHEFTYIDNGIGLSDEAHERIFEPFFTTARNTGGIGLGMSIVYNLVNKKLNGNVELLTPEKGFGIRLNLPKIAEQ